MDDGRDSSGALPRRRMLKALALAPATLAGCAAAGGSAPAPGADPSAPARSQAAPPAPPAHDAALDAIRSFRVPPDVEPAFVFRAGGTRPGEPR